MSKTVEGLSNPSTRTHHIERRASGVDFRIHITQETPNSHDSRFAQFSENMKVHRSIAQRYLLTMLKDIFCETKCPPPPIHALKEEPFSQHISHVPVFEEVVRFTVLHG